MAIKIIDAEPDIYLTQAEHDRLWNKYQNAFAFYSGTPPSFETWVKRQLKRSSNIYAKDPA